MEYTNIKWNKLNTKKTFIHLLEEVYSNDFIQGFANTIEYGLPIIIAIDYMDYNNLINYFGNNDENRKKIINILDYLENDEIERKKILEVENNVNINILNGKLKISIDENDGFSYITIINNKGVSYEIINSYQGLGKTFDREYCKKYLLYFLGINREYIDYKYGISFKIEQENNNTFNITILDKDYMNNLNQIVGAINPKGLVYGL